MPSAIVTTHYRYKRPSRKHARAEVLEQAVVSITSKPTVPKPVNDVGKAAIVTARKPGARDVPDMTPEEPQRRGDATDALFRAVTKGRFNARARVDAGKRC
jgi:hypothetical protein